MEGCFYVHRSKGVSFIPKMFDTKRIFRKNTDHGYGINNSRTNKKQMNTSTRSSGYRLSRMRKEQKRIRDRLKTITQDEEATLLPKILTKSLFCRASSTQCLDEKAIGYTLSETDL
jgi:hypothetical protein